jgi:TPR repeat protein
LRRKSRWLAACAVLLALALAAPALALADEESEQRYKQGLAQERAGNHKQALEHLLAAAERGHGPAQKKLGEIFDEGNAEVDRDYSKSIHWNEKARESGVQFPPHVPRP